MLKEKIEQYKGFCAHRLDYKKVINSEFKDVAEAAAKEGNRLALDQLALQHPELTRELPKTKFDKIKENGGTLLDIMEAAEK